VPTKSGHPARRSKSDVLLWRGTRPSRREDLIALDTRAATSLREACHSSTFGFSHSKPNWHAAPSSGVPPALKRLSAGTRGGACAGAVREMGNSAAGAQRHGEGLLDRGERAQAEAAELAWVVWPLAGVGQSRLGKSAQTRLTAKRGPSLHSLRKVLGSGCGP